LRREGAARNNQSMRKTRRKARGFTIIEIMIVVMIIGIISSLAIPFYLKTTARAHRTEVSVVLNKLRQYFVNMYNDQSNFFAHPGGFEMAHVGAKSAWNPTSAPGPGGSWVPTAHGWLDMPFPPEGNIKLRYRYSVDAPDQMTFYVCGVFPGFGAPAYNCGADDGTVGAISGNYQYQESLQGVTTTGVAEFPAPGF
jgi:prepilin-type N-terminal cleavage/methylation domain-containing protein